MENVSREESCTGLTIVAPRGMRSCGECSACCLTHEVDSEDLYKVAGVWREHCTKGQGCSIYSTRPENCKSFACEWLKGAGEDAHRPDRTGVVLDFVKVEGNLPDGLLQIFEVSEGALTSSFAKQAARQALMVGVVVLHAHLSGSRIIFVPANQPSIMEMLEQSGDRELFEIGSLDELET